MRCNLSALAAPAVRTVPLVLAKGVSRRRPSLQVQLQSHRQTFLIRRLDGTISTSQAL